VCILKFNNNHPNSLNLKWSDEVNICFVKGITANIDSNKRNSKNTDNQSLVDDRLYKERFSVERTNAWIDAFKALLVRFETKTQTWMSRHHLAFLLILIRI